MIATPHYEPPALAIQSLNAGYHALIEEPARVYTKAVREMNEVAVTSNKIFAIMYNQRTNPLYRKLKGFIDSGEFGELRRSVWIITDWYSPGDKVIIIQESREVFGQEKVVCGPNNRK